MAIVLGAIHKYDLPQHHTVPVTASFYWAYYVSAQFMATKSVLSSSAFRSGWESVQDDTGLGVQPGLLLGDIRLSNIFDSTDKSSAHIVTSSG